MMKINWRPSLSKYLDMRGDMSPIFFPIQSNPHIVKSVLDTTILEQERFLKKKDKIGSQKQLFHLTEFIFNSETVFPSLSKA